MINNGSFFVLTENCSCAGVANEWKEGAECNVYSGYEDEFMNSKWCYAETTTCPDATNATDGYESSLEEGRYGPSQSACTKIGK